MVRNETNTNTPENIRPAALDVARIAIAGVTPAGERHAFLVRPDLFDASLGHMTHDEVMRSGVPGMRVPAAAVRGAGQDMMEQHGYGPDLATGSRTQEQGLPGMRKSSPRYQEPIRGANVLNQEAFGDRIVAPLQQTVDPETGQQAWAVMPPSEVSPQAEAFDPHAVAQRMAPHIEAAAREAINNTRG